MRERDSGSGNCVSGALRQGFIAPLMRIEYTVTGQGDPSVNLAQLYGDGAQIALDAVRGSSPSPLIRREVAFDPAATPIPNSERVVLEYAANFDIDLMADLAGAGLALTPQDDGAAEAISLNNPHLVRSVLVDLAGRTADQEEDFPFVARGAGDALTRYQSNPALPGAARVRSMRTEIFLPNVRP